MSSLPYRPNVCMLLYNTAGQLLLGERNQEIGIWQFPQGGAEPGLTLEQNVSKELQEELGLHPEHVEITKRLSATNTYDFVTPPTYAVGRWRGQTQSFWLVKFLGQDSDIKLDRYQPAEFMNWRWCSPQEVRAIAEP
ncbi:MAG: NUDIX domain-containing protein, partial [Proteobacteria bacterium]|nr:NUDIX domain-containing protein [Pseudomonadota bacterium]